MQIQLYFDNLFEVSADRQDQVQAYILQPQLFILKGNLTYMFNLTQNVVMSANIPMQVPDGR